MDYNILAKEYLLEAKRLHARVCLLQSEAAPFAPKKEAEKRTERIAMLYDMYLECKQIGRYLLECGGRE